jgi:hypothetical protein
MLDFYQVWHNDDFRGKIEPHAKYLKLEDHKVPLLSNGMDIQEYRIYQIDDSFFESSNNFIGFASARWNEKFPNAPTVSSLTNTFNTNASNNKYMQAFISAGPHWIEHMSYYHRGMLQYLLDGYNEIGLTPSQLNINALPMCNSYICRKDIFYEVKAKVSYLFNFYEKKYQHNFALYDNGYGNRVLGCFYERVVMGCVASCANVQYQTPALYYNWP